MAGFTEVLAGKGKDKTPASQEEKEEWDVCLLGSAHSYQQSPEERVTA